MTLYDALSEVKDPRRAEGLRIDLALRAHRSNPENEKAGALIRRTLGPLFGEIASTMVNAFCSRAERVYGSR